MATLLIRDDGIFFDYDHIIDISLYSQLDTIAESLHKKYKVMQLWTRTTGFICPINPQKVFIKEKRGGVLPWDYLASLIVWYYTIKSKFADIQNEVGEPFSKIFNVAQVIFKHYENNKPVTTVITTTTDMNIDCTMIDYNGNILKGTFGKRSIEKELEDKLFFKYEDGSRRYYPRRLLTLLVESQ